MELWDLLDENGQKTGNTVVRGQPMKPDEYHLVVDVWILNSKNEFLISKRTPNKTFPNMWEIPGGSATTGDSSLQAALREVKEEIGIDLKPGNGTRLIRLKRQNREFPDFLDVWIFKQDVNLEDVVFQEDEVCDAKLATLHDIKKMITDGEFINVIEYLDEFNHYLL